MHIVVLANADSWYRRDLERAALARGHRFSRVDFRRLTSTVVANEATVNGEDICLSACDAVIVRTMPPGSLEQVVFRMDLLAHLESTGVTVLNPPKAIECAVDKYLTTARLQAAGLPVPSTVVCENSESAMAAFDQLGGDVIVKPIFGSEGRGILRVSDPDLAFRTFRTLERTQAVLYLQRYVDHDGSDLRVVVLDGRVIGSMRRHGNGDYRTNVSRSGTATPVELSADEAELALRAAAATGCQFAGVDLLYDSDGRVYVIEVNAVPGWRALSRVTGVDVAGVVISSLELGR
jgi:ribosomal protein S6--L-glutamate ligase